MVSGMKTLGEKVTRRPWAPSRTTRANAVRSSSGVERRSASESIEADLGGVGARGAVDQPQRPPGVDPGSGQVVAAHQRGHRVGLRRTGHREHGEAGRIDGRQRQRQSAGAG